jgi:hypothetical protein
LIFVFFQRKRNDLTALHAAATAQEALKMWEDDAEEVLTWTDVRAKMLALSTTPEDAWEVFRRSEWGPRYADKDMEAFEKVLALCKSKEQVQNVSDPISSAHEYYMFIHRSECKEMSVFFKMLRLREEELPSRPEDRKKEGWIYEWVGRRCYSHWGHWPNVK